MKIEIYYGQNINRDLMGKKPRTKTVGQVGHRRHFRKIKLKDNEARDKSEQI